MAWPMYSRTTEKPGRLGHAPARRGRCRTRRLPVDHLGDPGARATASVTSISRGASASIVADRRGEGGVAVPAVDDGAAVDRDDVALLEHGTAPGMPCTITSLGEAQITAGKPW